ncbi:DUF6502 family protein [Hydrogenovibrio marinus]|uniref:Uncharacterized protein n=1 Tax=Hydrogenovibrio marinus TaxID=28885 RepID=A0A067A353_HYDMR|nr:DUF6502 family protein [Hydrogenovibrio marinus]KDN96775.1 hypothetical protein EI16_11065 [Hydrogenovibrio marinus]BBN59028.1 hypothetical protein HVMH_0622 [Hydrogenovibrio marinus]
MESNLQTKKDQLFAKALVLILKPLVKILIHNNITYIGIQSLLKKAYVQVAEAVFGLPDKKQTDSRISLLTGIHRGDVKRIRESLQDQTFEKEIKASLGAQLVSVWLSHTKYNDESGNPLPLFKMASEGAPSFEELVLSVSKDKHPRSILDDWVNQRLISTLEDGRIMLNDKGYVPEDDFEEKLFFAGKNIGAHLEVVASNLESQNPPMFDRAIYYSKLSEESIEKLESRSKKKMMALLTEMNLLARQFQEADEANDKNSGKIHLGAYFYKKNEQDDESK